MGANNTQKYNIHTKVVIDLCIPVFIFSTTYACMPFHLFQLFSRRTIVPIDTTINERYFIRSLSHALGRKTIQPEYLCFALRSLGAALRCTDIESSCHSSITIEPISRSSMTTDRLLDTIIPVIYHKCKIDILAKALEECEMQLQHTNVTCGCEIAFSVCTLMAATRAAKNYTYDT